MRSVTFGALALAVAAHTFAATRTWTGTASGQWTVAANWGGTAPVAGDDLVFPAGASNMANSNDFPAGTAFNSISITAPLYQPSGNAITLGAGGLSIGAVAVIAIPFTLGASQTWTTPSSSADVFMDGPINLNGMTLTLSGVGQVTVRSAAVISGPGTIVKTGTGNWVFGAANTFTGQLQINAGRLVVAGNSAALGVGDNTPANGTVVNSGGILQINGGTTVPAEHLTLNGSLESPSANMSVWGGTVVLGSNATINLFAPSSIRFDGQLTSSGPLALSGNGTIILNNASNNFTGGVTWLGAATLTAGTNNVLPDSVSLNIPGGAVFDLNSKTETITSSSGGGNVNLGGGAGGNLTLTNASGTYSGVMSGIGNVAITGGTTEWFGANTFTGSISNSANFNLNGSSGGAIAAPFTQSAGVFGISSGATASAVIINGGQFIPGATGTKVANTGNLTLSPAATFKEVIDGTLPASFGNVHVSGTVNLGGSTLSLSGTGAGVVAGTALTIIDNDGSDAVTGTFAGLPQGAILLGPGGLPYTISYSGGTGNDVVLTALPASSIPALDPRLLAALAVMLGALGCFWSRGGTN